MSCCCPEDLDDGVPAGGGGGVVPPGDYLFGIDTTVQVTAAVATDVLGYTLPADRIATDGDKLHVYAFGDFQNNSGGNRSWNIAVQLNGVSVWQGNSVIYATAATRHPFEIDITMIRKTSTTVAAGGRVWENASATVPSGAGLGALTVTSSSATSLRGGPISSGIADPVVDWTINQAVAIIITPDGADAEFNVRGGFVETLRR